MTYRRPTAGEAATLILSQGFQGHLVDVVNAYIRGDFTKPIPDEKRTSNIFIKNATGAAIKPGQPVALKNNVSVSAGEVPGYVAQPLAEAEAITWHDNLTAIAVAQAAIGNNTTGPAATNTWARVITGPGGGGDWLMVDPQDTKRMLRATGGVARIINYDSSNGFAIADFSRQQDLWRYQLTQDVQGNTGQAQLMELDGQVYATSITVQFGGASPPCLKAGEEGFCYLGGNKFYALGTTSAFLGAPVPKKIPALGDGTEPSVGTTCDDSSETDPKVCLKQKVETALVFQCDDSPGNEEEITLGCLDQSIFDCLNLCQWICDNCTWMDYSADCDPPPCEGGCTWESYLEASGPPEIWKWRIKPGSDCDEPGCCCVYPPTEPTGADEEYVSTCSEDACEPPPCGTCTWRWETATQEWVKISDDCEVGCECVYPPTDGTAPDEEITTDCEQDPCVGEGCNEARCEWTYNASLPGWEQTGGGCGEGCECVEPEISFPTDGQVEETCCKRTGSDPCCAKRLQVTASTSSFSGGAGLGPPNWTFNSSSENNASCEIDLFVNWSTSTCLGADASQVGTITLTREGDKWRATGQDPGQLGNVNALSNESGCEGTFTFLNSDDVCEPPSAWTGDFTVTISEVAPLAEAAMSRGQQFVDQHPHLFRKSGCSSCRKEVVRVIDRWQKKKPTLQQIGILASTIHNKNRRVPVYDIVEALIRFMGMENERP